MTRHCPNFSFLHGRFPKDCMSGIIFSLLLIKSTESHQTRQSYRNITLSEGKKCCFFAISFWGGTLCTEKRPPRIGCWWCWVTTARETFYFLKKSQRFTLCWFHWLVHVVTWKISNKLPLLHLLVLFSFAVGIFLWVVAQGGVLGVPFL